MEEAIAFIAYVLFDRIFAYIWRIVVIGLGVWLIIFGWNSAEHGHIVGGLIMIAIAIGSLWRRLRAIWKP